MGVKDLWSILTPYSERKPINELRGKKVAIDLAGWVCESLNVVDYFVHPRQYLKNLYFRTCYLIWEQVTPVFVLEGNAPRLKSQTIAKRNELQFRGVKPKNKKSPPLQGQDQQQVNKGRSRFNHVLKQCEDLLRAMGIQCVQGPGEAEAYCAFLNKNGLVDGIISQDSDCFAYGAVRVYRNFSVSTQGAQAAAGGSVDVYDMRKICEHMDFGQHKIIVMALLCGCDYCPVGIDGVGKDGVLKLFNKYKETEILARIRAWRAENNKYSTLELRVDDKSICSNCGHIGRTQSHTKSGCGICRTIRGCNESLWKEERLSLKAELSLRKKALMDPNFPNEEIIAEFLSKPDKLPDLNLNWDQPNLVKFIKQIGNLLQWPEIYCFQKFFPILTRWQVQNAQNAMEAYVEPKEIRKKRAVKGVPSLELLWQDTRGVFKGLIPEDQLEEFIIEHPKGVEELFYTVEPLDMLQKTYPELVTTYLKSIEKPKKQTQKQKGRKAINALDNMQNLLNVTKDIEQVVKTAKRAKKAATAQKGLQLIDKFFKQNDKENTPVRAPKHQLCSTPFNKRLPSDLESDCDEFDMSDIINGIIENPKAVPAITRYAGHVLHYDPITLGISQPSGQSNINTSQVHLKNLDLNQVQAQSKLDDADLMAEKRNRSISTDIEQTAKRYSLDDSFDVMVKGAKEKLASNLLTTSSPILTHIERFKHVHKIPVTSAKTPLCSENVSYFFNKSSNDVAEDVFEQLMDISMAQHKNLVIISDSE